MPSRSLQTNGSYQDVGVIRLENGKNLEWRLISDEEMPLMPFGTNINISIKYEERNFLNGADGFVWATYDHRQAETIQNALMAQNISSEAQELLLNDWLLHLLLIPNADDVQKAIDFIWRDATGMRLQPDWAYPADAQNESFRKWINGS